MSEGNEMEADKLFNLQKIIRVSIEKLLVNCKKLTKARQTTGTYTSTLEILEIEWNKYSVNNTALLALSILDLDHDYFENDEFNCVREVYIELKAKCKDRLEELNPIPLIDQENASTPTRHHSIVNYSSKPKLPPIQIPTFSGSYKDWIPFYDTFFHLIHKCTDLAAVEKLHYLKSSLSGEASQLLRHLPPSDANYTPAWEILTNRYNNKRLLVNDNIKTLVSQKRIVSASVEGIKSLLDTSRECLHALTGLEIDVDSWDPIVIYLLVQKLDIESHKLWEQNQDPKKLSTFDDFTKFLENRYQTLENIDAVQWHKFTPQSKMQNLEQNKHFKSVPQSSSNYVCTICKTSHPLYGCRKFAKLSLIERMQIVEGAQLCRNCLNSGHASSNCNYQFSCKKCGQRHHTMLHKETISSHTTTLQDDESEAESQAADEEEFENRSEISSTVEAPPTHIQSFQTNCFTTKMKVLLATANIIIKSKTGQSHIFRALIDQGSEASFITKAAADLLGLKQIAINASVIGLGNTDVGCAKKLIQLTLHSTKNNTKFIINVDALILESLTKLVINKEVFVKQWDHLKNLELADPAYGQAGKIDLLLGADVYAQIILCGVKKGEIGSPVAQNTELGWILSGPCSASLQPSSIGVNNFNVQICIDEQLKRFWEIEEVERKRLLTKEEELCEKHYEENHGRDESGRYVVGLPLCNMKQLGKSRDQAVSRLIQMEKKFERNESLREKYVDFMNDYIRLGHMSLVNKSDADELTSCYLPHHAVFKESSTSTKLRVVFDASAKTSSGVSLNDKMMIGPTIQQTLLSILLRWRKYKYAMTADVEKMYRQILVREKDTNFQRIVWRNIPSGPIKSYRLNTVTYGTASAPFLAIRTLHQLAHDEKTKFPKASTIAQTDFYVDDVMTGADTLADALNIQEELIIMLRSGGMELKKWASNSEKILHAIPENYREVKLPMEINLENTIKTLGIHWHTLSDSFNFKVNLCDKKSNLVTKRSLLSEASRLFDPLGWLAPSVVVAKIMFQQLWLEGLSWDQKLPENLASSWKSFRDELILFENIRIDRWIGFTGDVKDLEIHGFCDASNNAYAAVIYSRIVDINNGIKITLLAAKTRVAPVKQISLPRLELCGALLLSKLFREIRSAMNISTIRQYAWTDSTVVLGWIRSHPSKWKTFVANRVAEIHTNSNVNEWRHVMSAENPADCASRGIKPAELINHSLWWTGPSWLKEQHTEWPKCIRECPVKLEEKSVKTFTTTTSQNDMNWMTEFSTLQRLLRVIAYCKRFIKNSKRKSTKTTGALKVRELKDAMQTCIQVTQKFKFSQEISSLFKNIPISSKSSILSLNPFVDEDGILRARGRLQNSLLSYEEKNPVILPYKDHLTSLVINDSHKQCMHGGIQLTLNHIRQSYWIIKGRNAVKQQIHRCVTCHRQKTEVRSQLMGNLPKIRLTPARPFTNTGVDYAGPLNIRVSKGRGNKSYKGYLALFICLATKAIHIEVVSDLTSVAFIAALKRFIARRGLCANIYCDNGTNFIGAQSELQQHNDAVENDLASHGIQWHFIPPLSPHFGGLWEAGVKSMKHHLRRIIGESTLTFEELATVVAQVEACLNSRPLCPLTEDIDDLNALTPGHFLIGATLLSPPQTDVTNVKLNRLDRWQYVERMHQDFWKIWSQEYLARLHQRPKWATTQRQIKIGDLVLVKDGHLAPSQWPLARVIECHPGTDDIVRVVTVKTQSGILKRNITHISLLPIEDNDDIKDKH